MSKLERGEKVAENKIYYCVGCGKVHPKNKFYVSENPLHANGVLPYCKDFIKKESYKSSDKSDNTIDINSFQSILMQMNIPFLKETYETALQSVGDIIGQYFRMFNSLPQNRGLTWNDSNFGSNEITTHADDSAYNETEFEATPEIINFWGKNFDKDEYEFLHNEYQEYTTAYECDSPAMEKLLQQAAYESLEIRRKRERRESVDKNLKNLQDLLGSANIKPVQETGSNATEQATFGTLIKKWENEKPIPDPLPEWKKNDLIQYVKVWFLGHLSKMINLNNPYADEYEDEINKYRVDTPFEDNDESGD